MCHRGSVRQLELTKLCSPLLTIGTMMIAACCDFPLNPMWLQKLLAWNDQQFPLPAICTAGSYQVVKTNWSLPRPVPAAQGILKTPCPSPLLGAWQPPCYGALAITNSSMRELA